MFIDHCFSMLYLKDILGNRPSFRCGTDSLADYRRFRRLRLIPSRFGVYGTLDIAVWQRYNSACSFLFSMQSCSHFSRQVLSLLESSYFSQRLMVVWLRSGLGLVRKALLSFLYFFSFRRTASLAVSFDSSVCFSFSWAWREAAWSLSSIFFRRSSISRSFCSIFFSLDCMRILSLVFSFSTTSNVCFSRSSYRHFLDSSSCTLLSSPRISISRSDCAITESWILCSSPSCSFFRNCSSSNFSRLLPILNTLNSRILFISFVAQYGSNRISSPSPHRCRSSVTNRPPPLAPTSRYLSALSSSGTRRWVGGRAGGGSKDMDKSTFLLRRSVIRSLQQLMMSRKSFLAASRVLIMCRCLTFPKMALSSSFSRSSLSIFLSYWICTTRRTRSSSPLMLCQTRRSLSQTMVFSWRSLVTLLRYSAQRRWALRRERWVIRAACSLIVLFLSLTASRRMSWYWEKVSMRCLNSFSVKVKRSLFMQLTQSSRSGTVITKPQPEESRSTRETLLRKRLMKACKNDSLYCCEMQLFRSATSGLEQLEIRCTRGMRLAFMMRFASCFGTRSARSIRIDSLRTRNRNSSFSNLRESTSRTTRLCSPSLPPSFRPISATSPFENCTLFSSLKRSRFSQRLCVSIWLTSFTSMYASFTSHAATPCCPWLENSIAASVKLFFPCRSSQKLPLAASRSAAPKLLALVDRQFSPSSWWYLILAKSRNRFSSPISLKVLMPSRRKKGLWRQLRGSSASRRQTTRWKKAWRSREGTRATCLRRSTRALECGEQMPELKRSFSSSSWSRRGLRLTLLLGSAEIAQSWRRLTWVSHSLRRWQQAWQSDRGSLMPLRQASLEETWMHLQMLLVRAHRQSVGEVLRVRSDCRSSQRGRQDCLNSPYPCTLLIKKSVISSWTAQCSLLSRYCRPQTLRQTSW